MYSTQNPAVLARLIEGAKQFGNSWSRDLSTALIGAAYN